MNSKCDESLLTYSLLNAFLQATMVQKRPFDAEEMLEVSFKHPKHAGPSDYLPLSESVFPDDDCDTHLAKTSGGSLDFNLVQFGN
jgi:hypothetical protein